MLRVTVELVPGGHETGKRTLAIVEIGNAGGGVLADYDVRVSEEGVPLVTEACINAYPRWASSIWDLVLRSIATALTGEERLPERPEPLKVPVHLDGSTAYVRFSELPEPARSRFEKRMAHSTRPVVETDPEPMGCAYLWDWEDFLAGRR